MVHRIESNAVVQPPQAEFLGREYERIALPARAVEREAFLQVLSPK